MNPLLLVLVLVVVLGFAGSFEDENENEEEGERASGCKLAPLGSTPPADPIGLHPSLRATEGPAKGQIHLNEEPAPEANGEPKASEEGQA